MDIRSSLLKTFLGPGISEPGVDVIIEDIARVCWSPAVYRLEDNGRAEYSSLWLRV